MSGTTMISFLGSTVAGTGQAVPQVVSAGNPFPVTLSGGLTGLAVAGVQPAGVVATANPVIVAGIDGTGTIRDLLTDGSGVLQVNAAISGGAITVQQATAANLNATVTQGPGNTGNPWTVQGAVAAGATASGNTVPMGGVFVTAPATLSTGQKGDLQLDANQNLRAVLIGVSGNGSDGVSNTMAFVGRSVSPAALSQLAVAPFLYNGTTWDRQTKAQTPFKLPSSAASNNAAVVKAAAGTVQSISAFNTQATTRYLKLFNTTTTPNPAVLAQYDLVALPTGATIVQLGSTGEFFATGIGVAIVANPADLDNTSIAAGDITALSIRFS